MGVFKLGKMTFGSLFKKPETVLYPIEKKPQPQGLKGHIVNDVEKCILCGICEKGCPTDCLSVDKAARTWSVLPFQCVQCGYCVQVCPKSCLKMDPNYWAATTTKEPTVVVVPDKSAAVKGDQAPADSKGAEDGKAGKLEAKLADMDPAKAEKVRAAMAAKAAKAAQAESAAPEATAKAEPASAQPTEKLEIRQNDVSANVDHELEAKLAMLDADKAERVRAALANR